MQAGLCALLLVLHSAAYAYGANVVALNGFELGRRFDGIGGLSGGGATSRFLPSYQKPYIDEIFDYLFRPNFGASLHICKVEIGGDTQTTEGTESSHMHNRDDLNFNRGYEWWIMSEAKKRNPDILLYGLSWGVPGWIGNGSFFTQDNIDYHLNWVQGAKTQYNLDIDFIGVWNERAWNADWIIQLRGALDNAGFSNTKIVAPDASWDIADAMVTNATLKAAVGVVGAHYPGTYSTANAQSLETPLWASEDYSTYADSTGGGCWGRILNQNYVNAFLTSTISWNLVAAYYDNLPYPGDGLMWAAYPWTGNYEVTSPIWVSAHTTQFTKPGWNYLAHGSGVGHLPQGGSYVTLVPPNNINGDFSLIIETFTHDNSVCIRPNLPAYNISAQNVTFQLYGLATTRPLYVWKTHLEQTQENTYFELVQTITPVNNQFSLELDLDSIVTVSTTTGQQKGSYPTPPPPAPFPSKYSDDFESYPIDQEADFFIDQTGVFEIYQGSKSKVMRQVVTLPPIVWCGESSSPISLIGEYTATDQNMFVDGLIETATGSLIVGVRVPQGGCGNNYAYGGYFFTVNVKGQWTIKSGLTILEAGTLQAPYGIGTWHTINIYTQGQVVCVSVDGVVIGCAKNNTYKAGFVSIGSSFDYVQFDNFKLTSSSTDCGVGDYIRIDSCVNGRSNTKWTFFDDGTVRPQSDPSVCLDIFGTDPDTLLPAARLRKCSPDQATQKWKYNGSTLVSNDGLCLDITYRSMTPCSNVELFQCNASDNQQWSFFNGQLKTALAPSMCLAATQ